jgi:GntR family transcriptional regulator/MocR family aminotransferase
MAGATLEPLPVDAQGLDVARLAARLARGSLPLRAIYLTPHHQFPTTVTLTPPRRQQLLALARQHRFAIIEDDYDFEFHYEGGPVQPLASRDRSGSVIYLGTLSKLLAPGLRLGFLVAPPPLVQAITEQRVFAERHGCAFVERAVAELIEDGLLQRQARKLRRLYLSRREALMESLRRAFKEDVVFTPPAGGMSLWAQFPGHKDLRGWMQRGLANGVSFFGGELFDFAGRNLPTSRLGFSSLTEKQLAEAVRRMAVARR